MILALRISGAGAFRCGGTHNTNPSTGEGAFVRYVSGIVIISSQNALTSVTQYANDLRNDLTPIFWTFAIEE